MKVCVVRWCSSWDPTHHRGCGDHAAEAIAVLQTVTQKGGRKWYCLHVDGIWVCFKTGEGNDASGWKETERSQVLISHP